MLYKLRKLLCYTIILTLFNTSFQPIFAFPNSDKDIDISSLPHPQRISNPSLEAPQVAESDIISRFYSPLKTVLGGVFQVTQSVIRHPLKAITMVLPFLTSGIYAENEFRVNQIMTGNQASSSVTSLTNRNLFAAWNGNQVGYYDIYGRGFFPNATALGNESIINQNTTGFQAFPFVGSLMDGNMLIAWRGDQTGDADIYARIFSLNVSPLSNDFRINQNMTGTQNVPSFVSFTNWNVFTAWLGDQIVAGKYDIFGRIFSVNGTAMSDEFKINQNTTGALNKPSLAILDNDDALVAWEGYQIAAGNYDIYGRSFSSNGTALCDEFLINQNMTGNQYNPSVLNLNNKNFFVIWYGDQTGTSNIYGRIFSVNRTALSNEFMINQNTAWYKYYPSIAILNNDNVIVTWESTQTGNFNIYARVFSQDGAALSNEFIVNQNTTGNQRTSSVARDGFVAWTGDQTGNYDIYGRLLDAVTLSSFLYPAPSPAPALLPVPAPEPSFASVPLPAPASVLMSAPLLVPVPGPSPVPAPLSAPASILASASLLVPAPKPAPVPALSPTLSPLPFTQSLSEIGSLSASSSSTDTPTLSNTPSSTSSVQSSSGIGSLETPSSSAGAPSGTSWKKTAAIAGGAGGSALLFGVLGFVTIKKCCFSEKNKPTAPDVELAEEGEETSTSSPAVSSFDPNSSGFTEFVGAIHKDTTYEIWRTLSNEREKLLRPLTAKEVPVVSPSQKIDFNLGGRRFRTVYPGSNQQTGEIYAIREVLSDKAVKESLQEGKIVRSLDHPNVMPLIDYSHRKQEFDPDETLKKSSLYQVMPLGWADGVDFKKRLTPLSPDQRERIVSDSFLQLMRGLNYLHGEGVVHLNIKDSNIIYTKVGTLRIADFARAKKVGENDQITDYNGLGDMCKFSPEIIALIRNSLGGKGERVQTFSGKAADIWAAGLFIWELLEDDTNNLFSDKDVEISTWVAEYTYAHFQDLVGNIRSLKEKFSDPLLTILRHVLRIEPSRRLGSPKIIELLSSKEMMPDERRTAFESLYQAPQDADGYSYQYIDLSSLRE